MERRPRCHTRKLPTKKFRRLSNEFAASTVCHMFSCSLCCELLSSPVTLECGHTFCRSCLLAKMSTGSCPGCGRNVDFTGLKNNVLVQDIVAKLVGDDGCKTDEDNKTSFPYQLRCRSTVPDCDQNANKCDKWNCKVSKKNRYEDVGKDKGSQLVLTATEASADILVNRPSTLTAVDLECVLCSRCLFEPVTTACGHTFCRGCLARVLDYGLACPLCMAPLAVTDQTRDVTAVLDDVIRRLLPQECQQRVRAQRMEIEAVEKDAQVPVFICTSAFPGVACPLYVYEPRYRLLARRCLQTNRRRFAMAAAGGGGSERFASYGTLLEVRDAVHLQDGRSILTTVGLRRFKVIARDEKDGYDTATVEYIRDHPVPPNELPMLRSLHERVHRKASRWVHSLAPHVQAEIEQSLGLMPKVEANWPSLPDGPSWAWWLMPILPLSSQLQVGFLSTLSLEKRLRAIDKMLERMSVRMRALKRNEVSCVNEETGESCSYSERRVVGQSMEF